ncbi:MAG: HD domain-containing protein [Bacilli bacterium]|nr:HD domain-containing protein [Bacilli bacterium]
MLNREEYIEKFNRYAKFYDMNNDKISRKYYHSFRVASLCEIIATNLGLDEDDIFLAYIIGLLHDIGRFKQATIYNTYDDNKSVNHAVLGVQILEENNYIENYVINSKLKKLVLKAIYNHNRLNIEPGLSERELLFCKIIRDADKIDIYKIIIDENYYHINDGKPSTLVLNDILNNQSVNNANVKSAVDKLICAFGYAFDINYEISLQLIQKEEYIDKLYNQSLNYYGTYKNMLLRIKNQVQNYINNRLEKKQC